MKTCEYCKSEITTGNKNKKYCDYKCHGKARRKRIDPAPKLVNCEFCRVEFETKTARYCQDCRDASIWSYGKPALKRAEELGIDWKAWRDKTYHW
jgi:hypothetical protein